MTVMAESGIDIHELIHPMLGAEWQNASMTMINGAQRTALSERFAGSGIEIDTLVTEVDGATARSAALRMTRERENMHRLGLTEADILVTELVADRRVRTAEFLRRLCDWASVASHEDYHYKPGEQFDRYNYALELYGVFQHGDWESTASVDGAIRLLPTQLKEGFADDEYDIESFGKDEKARLSYRYHPIFPPLSPNLRDDVTTGPKLNLGVVRRRRAVADVAFEGTPIVDVFKESTALVVVNMLPEQEKDILKQRKTLGVVDKKTQLNAEDGRTVMFADRLAGKRFELGIESRDETSLDIIPVSTSYIAKVSIEAATHQ